MSGVADRLRAKADDASELASGYELDRRALNHWTEHAVLLRLLADAYEALNDALCSCVDTGTYVDPTIGPCVSCDVMSCIEKVAE